MEGRWSGDLRAHRGRGRGQRPNPAPVRSNRRRGSSAAREREVEHDTAPSASPRPKPLPHWASRLPPPSTASHRPRVATARPSPPPCRTSGRLHPALPSVSPCLVVFSQWKGNHLNHRGKAEKGRWSLAEPRKCGSASDVEAVLGFTCSFRDGTAPKSPV
jgi:hypothetical protein